MFFKDNIQIANRNMKMLNITNHKGTQIKTQWESTSHLLEWLLAKRQVITTVVRMWRKRILAHSCWYYKLVKPLWKRERRFLKKIKIGLSYGPAIPLLGTYPKEMRAGSWKDNWNPKFSLALLTIICKQPRHLPVGECIKRMWCIYIHNGILFGHEKQENSAICNSMDGPEGTVLSEIN